MKIIILAISAILSPLNSNASIAACSDVSLVLAIDSSGSIDDGEYAMQIAGYAAAFIDPEVQQALSGAGVVDVAAVFWADSDFSVQILPWQRVRSPADAVSFSNAILSSKRGVTGDTDIGDGLWAALTLLDLPHRCTTRSVVNVSGDGRASVSPKRKPDKVGLSVARSRAGQLGVVVNGLAILSDEPDLERYYLKELIVGDGAFVMNVADFSTFGEAIKRKIIREVEASLSASLVTVFFLALD